MRTVQTQTMWSDFSHLIFDIADIKVKQLHGHNVSL